MAEKLHEVHLEKLFCCTSNIASIEFQSKYRSRGATLAAKSISNLNFFL